MGKIRWNCDDQKSADLNSKQVTYNKLARQLCNVTPEDRNLTKSLFDKLGSLYFNQINAQVKLYEAWKMERVKYYPIKFEKRMSDASVRTTRATFNGDVLKPCTAELGASTFISDAARAWNRSSVTLKNISSLNV